LEAGNLPVLNLLVDRHLEVFSPEQLSDYLQKQMDEVVWDLLLPCSQKNEKLLAGVLKLLQREDFRHPELSETWGAVPSDRKLSRNYGVWAARAYEAASDYGFASGQKLVVDTLINSTTSHNDVRRRPLRSRLAAYSNSLEEGFYRRICNESPKKISSAPSKVPPNLRPEAIIALRGKGKPRV
jgi:hypothetical protein